MAVSLYEEARKMTTMKGRFERVRLEDLKKILPEEQLPLDGHNVKTAGKPKKKVNNTRRPSTNRKSKSCSYFIPGPRIIYHDKLAEKVGHYEVGNTEAIPPRGLSLAVGRGPSHC